MNTSAIIRKFERLIKSDKNATKKEERWVPALNQQIDNQKSKIH